MKFPAFNILFFLVISGASLAAEIHYTGFLSGHDIEIGDSIFVTDPQYASYVSNTIKYKELYSSIFLEVNEQDHIFLDSTWFFTIKLLVSYRDTSGADIKDTLIELMAGYNENSGQPYQRKDVFNINTAYEATVKISYISDSTLLPFFRVGADIFSEWYSVFSPNTKVDSLSLSHTYNPSFNELQVSWTIVPTAAYYDLEWTWLDDYGDTGQYLPASTLMTTFRNNASRVTIKETNYRIPLIYDHGYLLYRVRPVGIGGPDFNRLIHGQWEAQTGTGKFFLSTYPHKFHIQNGHDIGINWQHTADFSEEGKRKDAISYFDGLNKLRAYVSGISTERIALAGETFYDYQGRKAVQTLLAPAGGAIRYYKNFNQGPGGGEYNAYHFDRDTTYAGNIISAPFNTISGAARYYSPSNPNQNTQQGYLPDAEAYPFSQTVYTPDNTGRIAAQGGAGPQHQPGNGHETRYFYSKPLQGELDRLFGNEAGYSNRYNKTVAVDPNGVVSINYTNGAGKVVATALNGHTPQNLLPLNSNPDTLTADLLDNNFTDPVGMEIKASQSFVVSDSGSYLFQYNLQPPKLQDSCYAGNFCLDFNYHLYLSLKDQAGNEMLPNGPLQIALGDTLSADTICLEPNDTSFSFGVELPPGQYTLTKQLKADAPVLVAYTDTFISNCTPDRSVFQPPIDTSGCNMDCADCTSSLGSKDTFLVYGGTEEAWQDMVKICTYLCDTPSICDAYYEALLLDVSPGGYYGGCWDNYGDLTPAQFPQSVFNINNMLSYSAAHWKNPATPYLDMNGNQDTIFLSDGQKLTPENLPSLDLFLNHWKSSWAPSLVPYHPEYCFYQRCLIMDEYSQYEMAMANTPSFEEALLNGYLNPLAIQDTLILPTPFYPLIHDPLFVAGAPGAPYQDTMVKWMANYQNLNSTLWQAVGLATGCSLCDTPCDTLPFGDTLLLNKPTLDQQWIAFKALYLTLRQKITGLLQAQWQVANYCFNDCYDQQYAYSMLDSISNLSIAGPENGLILIGKPVTTDTACYYSNTNPNNVSWGSITNNQTYISSDFGVMMPIVSIIGGIKTIDNAVPGTPGNPIGVTGIAFPVDSCVCSTLEKLFFDFNNHSNLTAFTIYFDSVYNTDLTNTQISYLLESCKWLGIDTLCSTLTELHHEFYPNQNIFSFHPDSFMALTNYIDSVYNTDLTAEQIRNMLFDCNSFNFEGGQSEPEGRCIFDNPYSLIDTSSIDCDTVQSLFVNQCDTTCRSYAFYWRQKLENCVSDTNMLNSLIDRMIEVCTSGCDPVHPMGSSSLPTGKATSYGDSSFYQLITQHSPCNPYLIGLPMPYSYTLSNETEGQMDSCTCLMVTDAYNSYSSDTSNSLDDGYIGFTNYFTALHQVSLSFSEVKNMLCLCNGTLDTALFCDPAMPLAVFVPNEIRCSQCVECSEIEQLLQQFLLDYPDSGISFKNYGLVHNYLNNTLGFNLGFSKYMSFMDTTMFTCINDTAMVCNQPLFPDFPPDSSCYELALITAQQQGDVLYQAYVDSSRKCFSALLDSLALFGAVESFTMKYVLNESYYTLYYYDRAGNLERTVPPEGVNPLRGDSILEQVQLHRKLPNAHPPVYPQHTLGSRYLYNTYNKPITAITPDGGTEKTWYDLVGRPLGSQKAAQMIGNFYNYTLYDALGRAVETGELTSTDPLTGSIAADTVGFMQWINGGNKWEYSHIYYDSSAFSIPGFAQENLRNRVATAERHIPAGAAVFRTHHSYDLHGNVKALVQENSMIPGNHRFKRMDYEYDLVSSNINKVHYQRGRTDGFSHWYFYDADNRIIEVLTSVDGREWEHDAHYSYYTHGPLARMELGDQQVQGVDYSYTLQGWLKAINAGTGSEQDDMGLDGDLDLPGNPHEFTGRDAFGYVLGYNDKDYKPVNGYDRFLTYINGSNLDTAAKNLYNGNIRFAINNTSGMEIHGTAYRYDVLNRLRSSRIFNNFDSTSAAWQNSGNALLTTEYATTYEYDMNGNILKLGRNGTADSSLFMDDMAYHYYPNTNRLEHISDTAPAAKYSSDIDEQAPGNYTYDASGNLVSDVQEGLAIAWNHLGKVKRVQKPDGNINFYYDANGNRVVKELEGDSAIYCVYGADNNLMALYSVQARVLIKRPATTNPGNPLPWSYKDSVRLLEHPIYGADRLGIHRPYKRMPMVEDIGLTETMSYNYLRGNKRYELKNHLGNVMVVVTDKKIPIDNNSDGIIDYYTADIRSVTDYYAGGMMMPGRNFSSPIYKFGYQGQLKTDEVYGSGNLYSYEFREQDPRLIRFWSIDPLSYSYPGTSSYAFSQNRLIDGIDLEGLEYISTNDKNISTTQDVGGTTTLTIGESSYPSSGTVNYNGQDYYNLGQNISGANGQKLTSFFVTPGQLQNIFPNASQSNINGVAGALNQNMGNYGIDTYKGLSQLLGQVGQETGGLTTFSENLNYSFNNLCDNYANNFSEVNNNTGAYVNNPQNWGNLVYAGRNGNSNVASGEGYKYRGRGLLQLTGKENYGSFNNFYNKKYGSGPNFLVNADLVATNINYATISGLWYFNSRVANKLNLSNASVSQITKLVTGKSTQGLIGRTKYYNTSIDVLH